MANPSWNPRGLGPDLGYNIKRNFSFRQEPIGRYEGGSKINYQTKRGFLYGYAETTSNARNALGQLGQWTRDQIDMNRATALEYQKIVARNITEDIAAGGRRQVSTGRLLQVTNSPRNVRSGADFWGVGIPEYLDNSQAKYWRTQEEGTKRAWKRSFIGDPLIGIWGGTIGPFRGGSAGPPWTRAGANRSGKFKPFGVELRRKIVSGRGRFGTYRDPVFARVGKEIDPMWAYKDAWEQIGGAQEMAYRMLSTLPGFTGTEANIPSKYLTKTGHRVRPRYPRGTA